MMTLKLAQRARTFLSDRRGAVLATAAAAVPVLVGFAGIGVDVGLWYGDKRELQTAADAAALSGAFERVRGNPTGLQTAAKYEATRNGFALDPSNTIAVNNPPKSGSKTADTKAVEVILTRPHSLTFSGLFVGKDVTIAARSVAAVDVTGEACVLALDPTASAAVNNQGSTTVNMAGCVLASNSNSASSIQISGSATVTAFSLWSVGQNSIGGSSKVTLERPATTGAWALDDPWKNLTVPGFSTCNYTNLKFKSGDVATIGPGVYCGGIDMTAQSTITMKPGTYIINRGDFSIGGQTKVRCSCANPGEGVTIILTSAGAASEIGHISISAGADVQLQAPSSESSDYRGVLFYQDRRAPVAGTNANKLNGGATMSLSGGVYIPQQGVQFAGNNAATTCTQIVARTVTFIGNSMINNSGCRAAGVEPVTVTAARLVE